MTLSYGTRQVAIGHKFWR